MTTYGFIRQVRNASTLGLLAILLSACLSGEKSKSTEGAATDNVLSGSVGDGPVVGAAMRVLRNDGVEVLQFESDSMANFTVTTRVQNQYYPLTIDAQGGIDLVTNLAPDFTMLGVVLDPATQTVANVNPFSTFAVAIARGLPGGITNANIATGQTIAATALNSGLSSLTSSGPLGTRIDSSNIAEIVKASETLAELVRRTRNLLNSFGHAVTGDEIILRLASDLVDSEINGLGGYRTDARTAAVAKVMAVQVLLESMSNRLRVNGFDATGAMESAIARVSSEPAAPTLDSLTVTPEELTSARIGLAALLAVNDTPKLAELKVAVDGLQAGMDPMLVRTLLPADYQATLDSALTLVGGGDASVIATINNVNDPGDGEPTTNRAPTIQGIPNTTVQAGSTYLFDASASDPDGDSLTFSITGLPVWAEFDESTGELSGMPTAAHVRTFANISISVTDGEFTDTLPMFSITVSAAPVTNLPPVISGNPASTIDVGIAYFFAPSASDPNNDDTLTFSVSGLPVWANFDEDNGRLTGVPSAIHVATYSNIIISVFDGEFTVSLAPFSITVNAVGGTNSPPTISGNPALNVNANTEYSFTPTASDPDDDTLRFLVSGLPIWAIFSETTGNISGTPGDEHVGVYSIITITVTDEIAEVSLAPFSITVDAISLGSVTLNWTAPTLNEDGTALTDLAGYRIHWGTGSGSYPNSEPVDKSMTTYVVEGLAPGTYEFVATAINEAGVESTYSNTATKTVP